MTRKRGRTAPALQTFYVFLLLSVICWGPFFFEVPRPDATVER